MWAFLGSMAAGAAALPFAVLGELGWAAVCLVVAIGAGVAARVWSHRSPTPMPHWLRWVLFLPRTSQSAGRLKAILQPRPGERLLEIGPGVGIHALPVGAALAPDGISGGGRRRQLSITSGKWWGTPGGCRTSIAASTRRI
jgi:hypothetical protein